jgi:hypothetical protein
MISRPSACPGTAPEWIPEKTRSPLAGFCRILAPMHWIAPSEKDTANATATRASAKTILAKPDRRRVGETELHYTLQIQANVNFSEANRLKFIIDLVICDLETGRTLCVLDTKYKCPDTPANDDISQVVTYAEIKGCADAILVYPRDLDANLDERLGDIRVRNLAFRIDGDLESAGQAFLASANLEELRKHS